MSFFLFYKWKTSVFGNSCFAKKKPSLVQNGFKISYIFMLFLPRKRGLPNFPPRKNGILEAPLPPPQSLYRGEGRWSSAMKQLDGNSLGDKGYG